MESHWLNVAHLADDDFAKSFVSRGETMLKLIGKAMGRDLGSGCSVFMNALSSAAYTDMYIEDAEEHDEIPEVAL